MVMATSWMRLCPTSAVSSQETLDSAVSARLHRGRLVDCSEIVQNERNLSVALCRKRGW